MDSDIARKQNTQIVRLPYPAGDLPHRKPYRYIRIANDSNDSDWQDHDQDRVNEIRPELEALQEELFEYRHMLDKLVRERTARLERRILILKYCNDNLVMRHNKLSQMYHDLLLKVRSLEANAPV